MDPPQSCSSSITINDHFPDTGGKSPAPDKSHDQAPDSPLAWLAVERDDVFYFETVTFQVEDTLFRVLKSGFEVKGSPFETMFSLPRTPGEIIEGNDDSNPIHLHGISKVNFRCFLHVLYPFKGAVTTYHEWIGALDLATMWDFKEIRKKCIEALSQLIKSRTVFDNILLARKYKVKKWLRDGYVQIIRQGRALELGDDICTSKMDAITIARGHFGLINQEANDYLFSNDEANKKIDEVFAHEIASMQDD